MKCVGYRTDNRSREVQHPQLKQTVTAYSLSRGVNATHTAAAVSAIALFITGDRSIAQFVTNSLSSYGDEALTILFVESLAKAIPKLSQNDSIDAVILDWDLVTAGGIDIFSVLVKLAPYLPVIVTGPERNLVQRMDIVERGADDYLLKSRLDAEILVSVVHIAIARKYRAWISTKEEAALLMRMRSMGNADDDICIAAALNLLPDRRVQKSGR